MKNHIDFVEIKNFKTIKHVKFNTKRINLFIGKPNVGKSNLLEALGLLAAPYCNYINEVFLAEIIRFKKHDELFYDKEVLNNVEIITNIGIATLKYSAKTKNFHFTLSGDKDLARLKNDVNPANSAKRVREYLDDEKNKLNPILPIVFTINQEGRLVEIEDSSPSYLGPVKKYDFAKLIEFNSIFHYFLNIPHGTNLFSVLQKNKKLYKEISALFKDYKLRLILDIDKSHIYLQKLVSGVGYHYDYSLTADTLQRYIFYLLAIETNKDSILLFEEPEAHSFPPYVHDIAQKIIADKSNQYFITTHSPYVLNTIIENAKSSEVSVFKVGYEKFKTTVHPLSDSEISEALNYGNDIIFNL